jgi:hypothetical protein
MRALEKLEPCRGQGCVTRDPTGPSRLDPHVGFGCSRWRGRSEARRGFPNGRLEEWDLLLERRRGPIRSGAKREHRPNCPRRQHDQCRKRDPDNRSNPLPRQRRLDRRVNLSQRRPRRYSAGRDNRSSAREHAGPGLHWQMPFEPAGAQKSPPFRIGPALGTLHCPTRWFCRRRRAEPSSFRAL